MPHLLPLHEYHPKFSPLLLVRAFVCRELHADKSLCILNLAQLRGYRFDICGAADAVHADVSARWTDERNFASTSFPEEHLAPLAISRG